MFSLSCLFLVQHRHPYIERLGFLYLMKLHHRNDFGTRVGAYWRLLFVLILMPWMRRYRFFPHDECKKKRDIEAPDLDSDDDDDAVEDKNVNDNEDTKDQADNVTTKNNYDDQAHNSVKIKDYQVDNIVKSIVAQVENVVEKTSDKKVDKIETDVNNFAGELSFGAQLELDITRRSNQRLVEKNRLLKDQIHKLREKLKEARGGNLGGSVESFGFGNSVNALDNTHEGFGKIDEEKQPDMTAGSGEVPVVSPPETTVVNLDIAEDSLNLSSEERDDDQFVEDMNQESSNLLETVEEDVPVTDESTNLLANEDKEIV